MHNPLKPQNRCTPKYNHNSFITCFYHYNFHNHQYLNIQDIFFSITGNLQGILNRSSQICRHNLKLNYAYFTLYRLNKLNHLSYRIQYTYWYLCKVCSLLNYPNRKNLQNSHTSLSLIIDFFLYR
jgi:hypothetical protein